MNDRFRFRVWAKPHEPTQTPGYYVYDADYIAMFPNGKVEVTYFVDNGYTCSTDGFEQDEIIIEQCTGQKDNKERLIFENDIMKNVYSDKVRYLVSWINNAWKLKVYSKENGYIDLMNLPIDIKDFEVIGNVHENPDMLKNADNFNISGENVKENDR